MVGKDQQQLLQHFLGVSGSTQANLGTNAGMNPHPHHYARQ